MPFFGLRDGEIVKAHQVDDGEKVECRECSEMMSVWSSFEDKNGRFVSRHFKHPRSASSGSGGGSECGGGESDRHAEMKQIALHKLQWVLEKRFDRQLDILDDEVKVGDGDQYHVADVLCEFETPRFPHGDGIIVEVQYRNESKDIESVSRYYHNHGYSVIWLTTDQFDGKDVELMNGDVRPLWPYGVPEFSEWSDGQHSEREMLSRLIDDHVRTGKREYIHNEYGVPSIKHHVESRVPATIYGERWCRELDKVPDERLWGLSAYKAAWGFGTTIDCPKPNQFDPPYHQREHRRPNSRSRNVSVNAKIHPDWLLSDEMILREIRRSHASGVKAKKRRERKRERAKREANRPTQSKKNSRNQPSPQTASYSIDYEPHPNANINEDLSGECASDNPRDWCLGPESDSAVHQCHECFFA